MAIFRRGPSNGASNASGVDSNRDSEPISGFIARIPPSVVHTAAPDRGKLVTLIADKRRHLLFTGDGRRSVYDKKFQRYAEDNGTEFNCKQR